MKKKYLVGLATLLLFVGMTGSAYATVVSFFGEDLSGGRADADAAHADFMSILTGVGTEDFEGFNYGTSTPISLDFGVAGTATLNGIGRIKTYSSIGRWATSGTKYWETNSNFNITFSTAISAFGFYGTDIGDFGGEVILNYTNGTTQTIGIGNTIGATDGSVLYFGFCEDEKDLAFNSISFSNTNGRDWFGFDDMTIGIHEQITQYEPTPEPSTVLLVGIGLAGLVGYSRKRFTAKS
ncbi:MAG: PEP-CTERM sorting domain-containing protein [Desulfobacteraceae bacterium]|nr:PEP-CTERM sorting domain-containing protein [Desulfobacteraceae bacterium]